MDGGEATSTEGSWEQCFALVCLSVAMGEMKTGEEVAERQA